MALKEWLLCDDTRNKTCLECQEDIVRKRKCMDAISEARYRLLNVKNENGVVQTKNSRSCHNDVTLTCIEIFTK